MEIVNHPDHYNVAGRREAIALIDDFLADKALTAYEGYIIGNVLKYLYRYKHKGDAEGDLNKALKYLSMLVIHEDALERAEEGLGELTR